MTNLPKPSLDNNTQFSVYDIVVHQSTEDLLEVKYVYHGYLRVTNGMLGFTVCNNEVRHATTAEIKAKRRLPEPVALFISSVHEVPLRMYPAAATAIMDMGEVTSISKHVSPLCRVLNKSYIADVIDHLNRAHKAQQEIS